MDYRNPFIEKIQRLLGHNANVIIVPKPHTDSHTHLAIATKCGCEYFAGINALLSTNNLNDYAIALHTARHTQEVYYAEVDTPNTLPFLLEDIIMHCRPKVEKDETVEMLIREIVGDGVQFLHVQRENIMGMHGQLPDIGAVMATDKRVDTGLFATLGKFFLAEMATIRKVAVRVADEQDVSAVTYTGKEPILAMYELLNRIIVKYAPVLNTDAKYEGTFTLELKVHNDYPDEPLCEPYYTYRNACFHSSQIPPTRHDAIARNAMRTFHENTGAVLRQVGKRIPTLNSTDWTLVSFTVETSTIFSDITISETTVNITKHDE